MLKSDLRKMTAQFMDARNQDGTYSSRWDFAANGEVDQAIGRAQDQEWRTLLDANPYLTFVEITIATNASGEFAKSALSTGSGDTRKRYNRVIGLLVNNQVMEQVRFSTYFLAARSGAAINCYYERGDFFRILPPLADQNGTFGLNYLPTRQDALAADGSTVNFPDGFEDVVAMEAAASLLLKGGAEPDAAAALVQRARERRNDMLLALGRAGVRPMPPNYSDSPGVWGV